MDEPRKRQTFIELCKGKVKRDLNGVFFGLMNAEEIYELFKVGQLTCAFCGHVSETKIRHKYHMICYCESFQHSYHEGD